ncbi:hypothetical protein [Rhodopila globiformis]|uniref:Uncharacterized protein n=1 Tax=Rhodopila globiformis TaxID=1071 RepID=A0A2S6NB21_RHOGL|nr:hypothetical protein [Rhodopila globiformis]PPQ31797.1 hypothetical protein CCS01_16385 [Rhodopila globiformis]
MIVHVAPRCVALVSKDWPSSDISIDLNTVLGVDLKTDAARRVHLVVRFTNGTRVTACTYARMAEAGPDCGRLRVLAGLPAWTGSCDGRATALQRPRRRPMIAATGVIMAVASLGLAVMSLRSDALRLM